MCGIAGIIRFHGESDDRATVERMLGRLLHRGPDDGGLAVDGRVTLGHRRLSILDLSAAGRQPMTHVGRRFTVVFNGEIYNYRELMRELGLDGASMQSHSDTEVLLHAWARWGAGALDHLVGQFAFAMLDRADGTLWLARDRFGEKPLFYHVDGARLVFASTIEALFCEPATPRSLDEAALVEFLTLRYVLAPRTIIAGVNKLPGGSLLRISADGTRQETRWYQAKFGPRADRPPRSPAELAEDFDERFTRACDRCLVSDVPVALLLSDGIDSHSIRSVLEARGHDVALYTFRLEGASNVALDLDGLKPTIIELTPEDYLRSVDQTCARQTEPVGDLAALATSALIARVRPSATVFLCGHGADEILGGYRLSQDRFRLAALRRAGWLPLASIRRGLDRHVFGGESVAARARRFLAASPRNAPAAARYLIQRPESTAALGALLGDTWSDPGHYLEGVDRLYAGCDAEATDLARMQEVMIGSFLCDDILPFADSSAMQSGAELRMPFLDRDLVELVLETPDHQRVGSVPGRTNTKLPLRRWARDRLPRAITHQRKRPFAAGNFDEIVRGPEFVRDRILGSGALRRALPGLEPWLAGRMSQVPRHVDGIVWSLLTLAVWGLGVGADP
jgi:asparagine synthase (glutamine-hydrolysing)